MGHYKYLDFINCGEFNDCLKKLLTSQEGLCSVEFWLLRYKLSWTVSLSQVLSLVVGYEDDHKLLEGKELESAVMKFLDVCTWKVVEKSERLLARNACFKNTLLQLKIGEKRVISVPRTAVTARLYCSKRTEAEWRCSAAVTITVTRQVRMKCE